MYPANKRLLSKKREGDTEEDSNSNLPEAQQVGSNYDPSLANNTSIFANTPAFPSHASPQRNSDGSRRATTSGELMPRDWMVTGKVACQTCQQRKGKCSGQENLQQIQHHLKCDYCTQNNLQCIWKAPQRTIAKAYSRRRPTTAGSSSSAPGQGDRAQVQTKSACVACQKRKQRCTGERPSCQTCASKGYTCTYDVADGKTRSEDLKFKIQEAEEREDKLLRLVGAMQHGTKEVSSSLLARLRMGASLEQLLQTETDPNIIAAFSGNSQPQPTESPHQYSETSSYQRPGFPGHQKSDESAASGSSGSICMLQP